LEYPLAPEGAADAVVEAPEVVACQISLVIARIDMIGDVEDLQPDRGVVSEEAELLRDLRVERHESRITADRIARPDEVTIGIDGRQWKACPRVEHREHGKPAREADARPHQDTVRGIPRQRASLVRTDHRVLDVAEEGVEVVEIADRRRTRVRDDDLIRV